MTQEEKSKRYDEALHKAKNYYSTTDSSSDIKLIGLIFPELKESEDERIRKALVEMVHDTTGDSLWIDYNVHKEDAIDWLEKQGEQKPAAWSEEDEILLKLSLENLTELKDRFGEYYGRVGSCIDWLKSLKDKYTWKPSDEQMVTLEYYMHTLVCNSYKETLFSLYYDLKKLREGDV